MLVEQSTVNLQPCRKHVFHILVDTLHRVLVFINWGIDWKTCKLACTSSTRALRLVSGSRIAESHQTGGSLWINWTRAGLISIRLWSSESCVTHPLWWYAITHCWPVVKRTRFSKTLMVPYHLIFDVIVACLPLLAVRHSGVRACHEEARSEATANFRLTIVFRPWQLRHWQRT